MTSRQPTAPAIRSTEQIPINHHQVNLTEQAKWGVMICNYVFSAAVETRGGYPKQQNVVCGREDEGSRKANPTNHGDRSGSSSEAWALPLWGIVVGGTLVLGPVTSGGLDVEGTVGMG